MEHLGKIREIEKQLDTLGVVRSPYRGHIKSMKWLGQTDQDLQVELSVIVELKNNAATINCRERYNARNIVSRGHQD